MPSRILGNPGFWKFVEGLIPFGDMFWEPYTSGKHFTGYILACTHRWLWQGGGGECKQQKRLVKTTEYLSIFVLS